MNTTEKLIEVTFNKKVWKKTKVKIIEWIILMITFIAVLLLFGSIGGMIEQWSISRTAVITSVVCLIWIVSFIWYIKRVN